MGRVVPRHAEAKVRAALGDTRVVLVIGARQAGKTTLVRAIGGDSDATWFTFDSSEHREAAAFDPQSFIERDGLTIIDEIQRMPDLLLEIKASVDLDPRPGRFLLTGSARVFQLRDVPDALPGRVESIELWPLSQGEIDSSPDGFVDAAFSQGPQLSHSSEMSRTDYIERVVRGGFPEAVARQGQRRERFFDAYVDGLIQRDIMQLAEIQRIQEMRAMVRLLAARSGQTLVPAHIGNELQLPQSTISRYLGLLEEVFLIKRVPAWTSNLSSRAVSTPKVYFVDSGIAANLLGHDIDGLLEIGGPLGGLLEGFVAMEIARQLTWSEQRVQLFHYRTRDKVEVDIVLENRRGDVVAIEVKASASVGVKDFAGIRHLDAMLGERLKLGLVLYTGPDTVPFGPKFRAMPISALWETHP
ncbi:MAG: ATP-binding protein [bacterium]|nr:ATP-binding protein [bacterium]